MPVFYGWMLDHAMPQAVFYTVFAFTAAAIVTVLQLPGALSRRTGSRAVKQAQQRRPVAVCSRDGRSC